MVEYSERDKAGTRDAKQAAIINEWFDRIELAAASASRKGNLN